MLHLIDKSAVVAEIERRKKNLGLYISLGDFSFERSIRHYDELLAFLDTIEVKEVNLEKEIQEVQRDYKTIEEYEGYPCTMYADGIEWIAKHFFELGLKAQKIEEL